MGGRDGWSCGRAGRSATPWLPRWQAWSCAAIFVLSDLLLVCKRKGAEEARDERRDERREERELHPKLLMRLDDVLVADEVGGVGDVGGMGGVGGLGDVGDILVGRHGRRGRGTWGKRRQTWANGATEANGGKRGKRGQTEANGATEARGAYVEHARETRLGSANPRNSRRGESCH